MTRTQRLIDHAFLGIIAIAALMFLLCAAALAQGVTPVTVPTGVPVVMPVDPNAVAVPYGNWIIAASDFLRPLMYAAGTALLGSLAAVLPPAIGNIVLMLRAEQLIKRAVDFGYNAVAGAVKDKALDLRITNQVLNMAARYAVDNAEGLVKKLGGLEILKQKILARLTVEPGVSVDSLDIKAPISLPEAAKKAA